MCPLHAPWCCRMRLRQWWHFGCPMSMLCSLCSLYRPPIPTWSFLDKLHALCILCTWSLCDSSMWRCAQDGESLPIQAWPSHSRWHCRTYIHCIRGGGAVPTHICREPSDALVQSRTSISLKDSLVIFSRLDMIGSIYVAVASQRLATTETQPNTKCFIRFARGMWRWEIILADHFTSYHI